MMDGELNIGKLMGDLELLLPLLPREKRAPLKQTLAGMTANPVALAAAIDRLRAVLAKQNARRAAGLLT